MTMKSIAALFVLVNAPVAVFANSGLQRCYQISVQEDVWARTPTSLCWQESEKKSENGVPYYRISIKSGLLLEEVYAEFEYQLLMQTRDPQKNKNVFGISNPTNSPINKLAIRFDGVMNMNSFRTNLPAESGTVWIGETKYFYRRFRTS